MKKIVNDATKTLIDYSDDDVYSVPHYLMKEYLHVGNSDYEAENMIMSAQVNDSI